MTQGIVEACLGALLAIIGVESPAIIRRRLPQESRNTVFSVCGSIGFVIVGFGAEDLRPHVGSWVAYGATFGSLFALLGVGAVIVRSRRVEDEAPAPLWKWTQRV